jgi:hypothetical protein
VRQRPVEQTFHKEAHAGQRRDRAETVHRSMLRRTSRTTSFQRSRVVWAPYKLAERRVSALELAGVSLVQKGTDSSLGRC